MKSFYIFLCLLIFTMVNTINLSAQDQFLLDWDFDTLFDEPPPEEETQSTSTAVTPDTTTVLDSIRRRGFIFDADFRFSVGVSPGYTDYPWSDSFTREMHLDRFITMRSAFTIDAQISNELRVRNTIYFQIPDFKIKLGDFFFDYNINDNVFIRGGKYDLAWGITSNFNFTNLLARVPEGVDGESFILKAEIPIGVGGLQLLALTRLDMLSANPPLPKINDFGYGAKYTLALREADFDFGFFYQEGMPFRSILSIKTTLWNTEFYNEYLLAIDNNFNVSGALNLGFANDYFNGKLSVNAEIFYNGESGSLIYEPETDLWAAGASPFIEGLNFALNLTYRPWDKWSPRIFLRLLYAPMQNSAQLIPGIRLTPLPNLEFYFAIPMALGSKEGYYYDQTKTRIPSYYNERTALPFSVVFMVTLNGGFRFSHNF